jgi:hypothetical protein
MNDPHVESLEYTLETDPTLTFKAPPPLEHDTPDFNLRLKDGLLTVTMKTHAASEEEARRQVEPFLQAWELDQAIQRRRREMRFKFQRANVIDRNPMPGAKTLLAGAALITVMGMTASLTV